MTLIYRFFLFTFCFAQTLQLAAQQEPSPAPLETLTVDELRAALVGEYDNFQQHWQENTAEERHRVAVRDGHDRIHTVIRAEADDRLVLRHYLNDDEEKLVGEEYMILSNAQDGVEMRFEQGDMVQRMTWKRTRAGIRTRSDFLKMGIRGDTLLRIDNNGAFANSDKQPYRAIRCRFFSGWIQYPMPDIADSTYFMGNLVLHDQGDKIQLRLGDDRLVDYTVELTQLVFGKRISIMKLALYELPAEKVGINSRSVSYAWADPGAKRLGINVRYLVSGWTLMEEGFVNTNNMK